MQPVYYKSSYKKAARSRNIEAYRDLTGNRSIPIDRQYWTLCSLQPLGKGSEIVQMVNSGILVKTQFYGVDQNPDIIKQNSIWHPEAHWYYGDWVEIVENIVFNPALIYLDSTAFADRRIATDMVVRTMMLCPPNTMLIANLMGNNPHSKEKFDSDKIIENVQQQVPSIELAKWKLKVPTYSYSVTGITEMLSYIFYKEKDNDTETSVSS